MTDTSRADEQKRDAVLKKMLNTPPQPRKRKGTKDGHTERDNSSGGQNSTRKRSN
jgi:hypothetical protein